MCGIYVSLSALLNCRGVRRRIKVKLQVMFRHASIFIENSHICLLVIGPYDKKVFKSRWWPVGWDVICRKERKATCSRKAVKSLNWSFYRAHSPETFSHPPDHFNSMRCWVGGKVCASYSGLGKEWNRNLQRKAKREYKS